MSQQARMEIADFSKAAPEVGEGLRAVTKAVMNSGLEKSLTELIKIRASQINGCAFCVQFHLNLAREAGVSQSKFDLLAVWEETDIFTPRERAALAWTEALTRVPVHASDHAYASVQREFTQSELVFLTSAIASINAWNRIAVAYRFTPPIPQETSRV